MPSDDGLRLEDFHRVQHLRSQPIEPRKHQAIDVFCPSPTTVLVRLLGTEPVEPVDFSTLSFHVPISGSTLCPDAGSVKPIATMMPRYNCFIDFIHIGAIRVL
jgi:hypothetical protein